MPRLLTPEQLHEIQAIVEKHHAAVIAKVLGPGTLTPKEQELLKNAGILKEVMEAMKSAYLYGKVLAQLENQNAQAMDYAEFQAHMKKHPVPLSEAEKAAVEIASHRAGVLIRHLGSKVVQQVNGLAFQEDQAFRTELLSGVREKTAENIEKREGLQRLKKRLGELGEGWDRDWIRVAMTEKQNAMQQGVANTYLRTHGSDVLVFRRPMPDACPHCIRLHIGPDGFPRIFKLSELMANGTNEGRKARDWRPVSGTVHPHCQCVTSRVPPGWGFNEEGDLVPGGRFGTRQIEAEEAEKGLSISNATRDRNATWDLKKGTKPAPTFDFQGLPIVIENPAGSVRHWRDRKGREGETVMRYAYGYIEGTKGADGDEYDIFVGPDSEASFVYVVHQTREDANAWDEDKALVGFSSLHEAKAAYLAHYDDPSFLGSISMMPIEEFKAKVFCTKEKGALEQDGMVKADLALVIPFEKAGLAPEIGAATSQMGQRNVTGTGINFVFDSPRFEIYERPRLPATPIPVKEAILNTQSEGMLDPHPDLKDGFPELHPKHRTHTFVIDPDWSDLHEDAREFGLEQRYFLDLRADQQFENKWANHVDVEEIDYHQLEKAGPFIGPRGGLWADPLHTVPYKPPKPAKVRKQHQAEKKIDVPQGIKWHDGTPPGIPPVDAGGTNAGKRGGTEELHWDKEANDYTKDRKAFHRTLINSFKKGTKSAPKDRKPVVFITMGGPASGKSSLLDHLPTKDMVKVDADKIRQLLPEYREAVLGGYRKAASFVHEEAYHVATTLLEESIKEKRDIVFDTTGTSDFFVAQLSALKKAGYEVTVFALHTEEGEAVKRAEERGEKTGRFVAEKVVRSIHQKFPKQFMALQKEADSVQLFDTTNKKPNGEIDLKAVFTRLGPVHVLHSEHLFDRYHGMKEAFGLKKADEKGDVSELSKKLLKDALIALAQGEANFWKQPKRFDRAKDEGLLDVMEDR